MRFRDLAPVALVGVALVGVAPGLPSSVRAAPGGAADCRCLTPYAAAAHEGRPGVPPCLAELPGDWLDPVLRGDSAGTVLSPSGFFSLHYVTSGPDSVSVEDVDPANGIPDFVERCAEYADRSLAVVVDSLQFTPPVLPPDGTYDITFLGLPSGTYGYTTVTGATTEIVVHRSFTGGLGWAGPNDDPDGDALGRAKVTIAHELKHASQYSTSGWTEGLWIEADAMWVEEVVYPVVNEYRYWVDMFTLSQLDAPWVRIDNDAGQGNYEDCLWHHWIEGQWGSAGVRDFWTRRAQYAGEPVTDSYAALFAARGTDWPSAYAGHLEWCWFTDSRAQAGFGFADAPSLFKMRVYEPTILTLPHFANAAVDRLSGHPRRIRADAGAGRPRVRFDGEDGATGLVVSVVTCLADSSFTIDRLALDGANAAGILLEESWSDLAYLAVIVTNGDPADTARVYDLEILDDVTTTAPALPRSPDRLAASPNPARGPVTFAVPAAAGPGARIRVLDVAGREVRSLAASGSPGQAVWDGRDAAGRPLPAGVYWAVTAGDGRRFATRVVRVH